MNKKMHTRRIVRRLLFTIFIIVAFILQCSILPLLHTPFPVFILIPLIISVSMFEKEFSGFFFGVLTGALWDTASVLPDGLLALVLSTFSFFTGLISKYLIRNTLLNNLIICIICCIAFSTVPIICIPGSLPETTVKNLINTTYVPGCVATIILAVPIYFITRAIALKLREETI